MLKLNTSDNPQLILITGIMAAGKLMIACFVEWYLPLVKLAVKP